MLFRELKLRLGDSHSDVWVLQEGGHIHLCLGLQDLDLTTWNKVQLGGCWLDQPSS